MFELAFIVIGLTVFLGPILLLIIIASLSNQKKRWRQLQARVVWLTEELHELRHESSQMRKHLEGAELLPASEEQDEVGDEAELERPVAAGPPYQPSPSAPPASTSTPATGEPRIETPAPEPVPPTVAASAPSSRPVPTAPPPPAEPRPPSRPLSPAKPRPPSAFDKWRKELKEQLAGEGWEAVIGGSWLNKIGSLVTVVGVVLILSWSWANLDPEGRVAMALVLSLALLAFGMVLERRLAYVIVARGFIGTGWAALYVTAYAMHGIKAARIIHDPLAGFLLLLAVAVGMILHSLRYRSQTVTGIAYFVAFATLTLTDFTHYAWFASLPLAASLLYVAYRFTWSRMVLMGLLVTYGTFMFRIGGLQASDPLVANWNIGQGVLILYWLMFESFDLLSIAKSGPRKDITATIFPLNAAAFLGISLLEWSAINPETLYLFFAMAGGAYVVSAVLRARLLPDSGLPESSDVLNRALMGSYEGAVSIAAALIAAGIWQRYEGLRIGAAWLLEAEILFLIGLQLRRPFLRWLAGVVVALPVIKLIGVDIHEYTATLDILETDVFAWVPLMLLTAAVLYLNRGLVGIARDLEVVLPERAYTYAATALVVIVLGHEVPVEYLGLALLLFALSLFETGLRSRLAELRYQAYGVGILGSVSLVACNVIGFGLDVERPWLSLIPAALLTYGVAVRLHRLGRRPSSDSGELLLPDVERSGALDFSSVVGTMAAASLVWHLLPTHLVPVGWLLLAIPLFETGLLSSLVKIRYQAYIMAALACGWLLTSHVLGLGLYVEWPWLNLIPAALLTYGAAARLYRLGKEPADASEWPLPDKERSDVLDIGTVAGTVAVACLAWRVLPTPLVAVAWGLLGLLLIEIGYWLPLPSLRAQGHVLAFSAFARTFLANFVGEGATAGISHRVLTVVPLIALYYYLNSKLRIEAAAGQAAAIEGDTGTGRDGTRSGLMVQSAETVLARIYLYLPAILAVVLIYYEFGPVPAVIGWAVLALVLMVLGVRWDREDFRLQAYMLGILVFARSWSSNFYVPGDVFGLPGRLATGVLVAVSLYACQFVSPRWRGEGSSDSPAGAGDWLDVHSRTFFSLLATTLLTLLLYYELSRGLLTVAWTLEGTLLLLAGFALRERALRLSGLVLLGACVLKAFLYDFQELETIYRILSFIVLGLLMLGISLVYTRYKEQILRLL